MDVYSERLVEAVDRHVAGWVVAAVGRYSAEPSILASAEAAGVVARAELVAALTSLLAADIDEQRSTPLTILRGAVRWPTEVLQLAGVAGPARDEFSVERFPDDPYDLMPSNFADIHPEVGEAGLAWGAAKAFAHKARHGRADVGDAS